MNMDANESWFIQTLWNPLASDADVESSIEVLEVLLSVESLPSLVAIMKERARSGNLRERAARAIKVIGAKPVREHLVALRESGSQELIRLANIALGSAAGTKEEKDPRR